MTSFIPETPDFHPRIFSVGVTGTNGKTTTTRLVARCLGVLSRPVAQTTTLGSFLDDEPFACEKSWDGFVATLREGLRRGGRFAAIEATSEALMRGFARAWPCNVGIFTNLTHDHLDAHGSADHYLASKAQLFVHLGVGGAAVLHADDPCSMLLEEVIPSGVATLTYGTGEAMLRLGPEVLRADESEAPLLASPDLVARFGPFPDRISVRGCGKHFLENATAALLGAVVAGIPPETAADAIAKAPLPHGRFEKISESPCVVIDYAHTPDALRRTLAAARGVCAGRVWLVFGAGGDRDREKRAPMGAAAAEADAIVLTSDNPRSESPEVIARALCEGIRSAPGRTPTVEIELDRRRAIQRAIAEAREEDLVLIAGKGHEETQEVQGETRPFSDRAEALRALGRA